VSRAKTHRGRAKTNAGKRAQSVAPTERVDKQRAESIGDDLVIEITELPSVPSLALAIFEADAPLQTAASAVTSSGHTVACTGSGDDGIEGLREMLPDVDALVVALPGGERLIDAALALEPRRPIVIAACSGSAADAIVRATTAGADLCTTRPYTVDRLAPVLLAAARLHAERFNATVARGSEAALRARLDQLAHVEPNGLQPFELFQRVLELELKRARRYEYSLAVALFAVEIDPPPPPPGVRGILRARAGNALVHSIRDIDMATEVDHERYLVLLPYTDLTGAAEVARRIIASVAECPPVVAAGRTFPARVVGAVAGASPGQPLSFARLMRDATHALEQARRDGAELAVQP
jgi:PleD family two-component response regulator